MLTPWRFLDRRQIDSLVSVFGSKNDCFKSIQSYNSEGKDKECSLFADFDGVSAKKDALDLANKIKVNLGTYPEVYDSGGKGMHVVLPVRIFNEHCEKIAKHIITQMSPGVSWDAGSYKTRQLWRIPDTYNYKGGRFKRRHNIDGVFSYKDLSRDCLSKLINSAKEQVEEDIRIAAERVDFIGDGSWQNSMVPCIEQMLESEAPEGSRHHIRVLLARFFRHADTDMEEGIQVVLRNPFYKEREQQVRQVFKSIYESTQPIRWGCKREEILLDNCVPWLCEFSEV